MPPTRSGIPTTYRSANFRSLLEARWATFFDLVGWHWVYEPFEVDGYIPDFLIQGERPFFVEVGPCITQADYIAKGAKADVEQLGHDLLVVGATPIPDLPLASGCLAAGWLGEIEPGHHPSECQDVLFGESSCRHSAVYGWGAGVWARGDGLEIYHTWSRYSHRPHGVGHESPFEDRRQIEDIWSEAGSRVQWKRSA